MRTDKARPYWLPEDRDEYLQIAREHLTKLDDAAYHLLARYSRCDMTNIFIGLDYLIIVLSPASRSSNT
jgi:hypothetical protein